MWVLQMNHCFNKGKEITIVIVKVILGCIILLICAIESTEKKIFWSLEKNIQWSKTKNLWQVKNHMENF